MKSVKSSSYWCVCGCLAKCHGTNYWASMCSSDPSQLGWQWPCKNFMNMLTLIQEFTRKLKRKPWRASKIAGTQKADSSWKSIKKWIPDTLETTGRFSRRINPHLLQYIRSWQWRSQEKNDCVSHLSKALKAMYARWGKKKVTSETPLGRCILTTLTKCRFLRRCALKNARRPQEDLPLFFP